jgi:Fe-S-cluster containining protein
MRTLQATGEDVKRWRREGRDDILRFVAVLGRDDDDPWGDLWIDDDNGVERARCPFVRKLPNRDQYTCTIYETRPEVCRQYEPWTPHAICEIPKSYKPEQK